MGVRRCVLVPILLIALALSAVLVAVAVPGTAQAHTSTATIAQQQTTANNQQRQVVANDQPSYPFDAGAWGYGYCFSHADIQSLGNGWGHGVDILGQFLGWRFGGTAGFVAASAVSAARWYAESIDRGKGDCLAFAYNLPYLPVWWASSLSERTKKESDNQLSLWAYGWQHGQEQQNGT